MDDFIKRWQFTRLETYEILSSLDDKQLLFQPEGNKWQPLYYQFACMARTQLVYAMAVETGMMDFALFGSPDMPNKHDYQTKASLEKFLDDADRQWLAGLDRGANVVDWAGDKRPAEVHIMSLAEHERLHHGQIVSYFTLAGYNLPGSFRSNWAL